jgi:molybdopterin synthase catalytic subunit
MAQKMMDEICAEAMRRWAVDMAISHRLGLIEIGEASVGIVVASAHRADAFEACRYAIERIKADVPIWKREYYEECAVWVEEPAADPEGGRIANE